MVGFVILSSFNLANEIEVIHIKFGKKLFTDKHDNKFINFYSKMNIYS